MSTNALDLYPKQDLTATDLQKLESNFIPKAIATKAGLFRGNSEAVREMLGIKAKGDYAGMVFPYFINGKIVCYRARLDKPPVEERSDGTSKEQGKYRSAPRSPVYPYIPPFYTQEQLKDKSVPIFFVEGEKKALALYNYFCLIGSPAIVVGLAGVWMFRGKTGKVPAANGGYQDVKGLLRDVVSLGLEDRSTYIIYDTNIHTNDDVKNARDTLVRTLKRHKTKVITVDLPKELLDEGINGVDDVLYAKGTDYLTKLIKEAEEKAKASVEPPAKATRPKGSIIADLLTEQYQDRLAYNAATKMWFFYCNNKWEVLEQEIVRKQVQKDVKHHYENTFGYYGGFEDKDITSIMSLLKSNVTVAKWEEKLDVLPLKNGVLDLKTMELKPHSPRHQLTWQLPYSYDPNAKCQPIIEWLLEITQGDFQILQFLRAYLRAVLLGRTDLQVYLEMIGFGGSGKGTFIRLVTALIGVVNTAVTDLENLETNRFETSKLYGKRLAIITDADHYSKSLRVLKQITGQDRVRAEKKGKDSFDFTPECMVIVAANEAIQSADSTSGVARRKRTVIFNRNIEALQRRNLVEETRGAFIGEFIPYLPGLLNWALEMTDQQMVEAIHNSYEMSPLMQQTKIENLLKTHPLAEWFNEKVAIDPNGKAKVGLASGNEAEQLYANYVAFTIDSGNKPLSVRSFSEKLEDLSIAQLKLKVSKKRITEGTFFFGVRLKTENDKPYSISGNIPSQPFINEESMKDTMKGLLYENAKFNENEGLFNNSPLADNENKEIIVGDNSTPQSNNSIGSDNNFESHYREEVEKDSATLHNFISPVSTIINSSLTLHKPFINEESTLHCGEGGNQETENTTPSDNDQQQEVPTAVNSVPFSPAVSREVMQWVMHQKDKVEKSIVDEGTSLVSREYMLANHPDRQTYPGELTEIRSKLVGFHHQQRIGQLTN